MKAKKTEDKTTSRVFRYDISIKCDNTDTCCSLSDTIEAKSLADAYEKALDIAKKLDEKANKDNVFSVISILRSL